LNQVAEKIRKEIEVQGAIPFARFMELALYCPDCGYYEKEDDNIGRRGDFQTSVSVGSLFGELLAFQFSDWLAQLPGRVQVVEAGAHDGRLAADILRWWEHWRPELFARVEYVICEPSPRRQCWQREQLREFPNQVRWLANADWKADEPINGVVFGNELLDAFPVHRLGWDANERRWFEWGVRIEGVNFAWTRLDAPPSFDERSGAVFGVSQIPPELLGALPDGFTTEVSPAAATWWRNAATALRRGWLVALVYGLSGDEFFVPQRAAGTLRAYRHHRYCEDVLACPGDQDITAQVNFSVIQEAGEAAGLRSERLVAQASFFTEIMKSFWPEAERQGAWGTERSRRFQTLIHPEHLGRAFRVLVQTR